MAKFQVISQTQAEMDSATGKRAETMNEYLGYLSQLNEGDAGKLEGSEDESPTAVRRRIGKAAEAAGKEIIIKRKGDVIYFWLKARNGRRRRRGPSIDAS